MLKFSKNVKGLALGFMALNFAALVFKVANLLS